MTVKRLIHLIWICVSLVQEIRGSLVKTNLGLKVKRGQSVFLQEEDLQFHIPRNQDACKLEVVMNEPITQRVGSLTPQVFDCHFLADEVKYTHDGCPLLKQDTVSETYSEVFSLQVQILEPDCNLIHFGTQRLLVPQFYGLSNILDRNIVSFHYEHRHNLECNVRVTSFETFLPVHGRLVSGEPEELEGPRGDEPDSFIPLRRQLENKARAECWSEECLKGLTLLQITRVPCQEFLNMGIRYQHTDPPSPDIDYISISLELTDTRSQSIVQSEQAWIPVTIKGAMPNQPPRPAFMSMFILEVDQFILTPLSISTLDAEDDETPKNRLIFNITKPPQEGFLTHLTDHTRAVSSFTWNNLNDMMIAFQPPNASHTHRRNYEMEFEVHDFYFEKSQPMLVHVSIRTADTNAPRVSWNMGLSLLEGQSRPITWDQLQIVDNDNINAVKIITLDGLQHGRLTVRGGKSFMFTVNDIKSGVVRYHHDDTDTIKDYIIFRVTDGLHQTRHKFPINILPKDDSPPFLISNMVLELPEGQTALLRGSILQACDLDSSDDYIMFNITRSPRVGEIMKMPGAGVAGYPVTRFLQKDLFQSIIYYRHSGSEVFDDSFEVVLSDFHDPPNLSEPQVIMIQIQPVPDQPPQESPGATRHLVVKETDVIYLTKQQLHFLDLESPDSELTYTVTTPPFYTSTYGSDAGRLFLVDSIPKFKKDPNTPMLRLFTQHAVNYMKVAYMPPILDIGVLPQQIQFVLSVTNQQGSTTTGICFNVTLLPVDNLAPEESLHVELKTGPLHGTVLLDGKPIKPGQSFAVGDLKSLKVRYRHDSSETEHDEVKFIATDGINCADFVLHIKVTLVNDEVPVLMPGLRPVLSCGEGQEVLISQEYICATDLDSEDASLMFLIARQPYHGVVQRQGIIVDRFIQSDITAGFISYRHTGQEIGLQPRHDVITLVISDGESGLTSSLPLASSLPVYDLNITVYPFNNQPPTVTIGEVFVVDEGGSSSISEIHIRVEDLDSAPEDLQILLVSPPEFGYIENILPSPGFEKSNMGISINSFSYRDVLDGYINYVQSKHQRLEPTADQLLLQVSDGKYQSSSLPFYIIIRPTNDEIPNFMARNITVQEAGVMELDSSVINAVDLDVPQERLRFTVVQGPLHGAIMSLAERSDVVKWSPVQQFTMDQLLTGITLRYVHDDSESDHDEFVLQLSDGKHKLQKLIQVKVLPVNDQPPIIIRNSGISLKAGESRLISGAVLSAQDKDTPSSQLLYVFEAVPTHGVLQIKVGSGWATLSSGVNCSQDVLDLNLLRYLHTGRDGAAVEDFFVFHLFDGKNLSPAQHFHISLRGLQKGEIALFLNPVHVSRGERVFLSTDVLLALDGSDKPEDLHFFVMTPPLYGRLELITNLPQLKIQSFTQMDVAANRLAYIHNLTATSRSDCMKFMVSNGFSTRNGTLEIIVNLTDQHLPSLLHNRGLRVPQGSRITLTPLVLFLSDLDSPTSILIFRLFQTPRHGTLLLKGRPLSPGGQFSQKNIEDLDVAYQHAGGPSEIDGFTFTASDSGERGFMLDGRLQTEPVFFSIQIEALEISAPQIVLLDTLWKVELLKDGRFGIFMSSREIRAQDSNSADADLTFHILRAPHFGYLENYTTALSDSLEFAVSDLLGNTGPSHRMEFSWAEVQFSSSEFIVCEAQGSVSLTIQRKGNLLESSYVTVKMKELTASAWTDFIPASSLIQFDPGLVSREWKVTIVQDSLEEAEEQFEVHLVSPVAAVLKISKATVIIKNGQCGQGEPAQAPPNGSVVIEALAEAQRYRGDGDQELQTPAASKRRLRVTGNGRVVKPSAIIRHGPDIIYKYDGIMSMRLEEEESSLESPRSLPKPQRAQKRQQELFSETSGRLLRCDGGSWKPWSPSEENVKAQKCPAGWTYHNHSCYTLNWEQKASWNAAARACRESFNASLTSVGSKSDLNWLWDFSQRKPFWIGLNEGESRGRWEWMDGQPITFTNWRRSPPKPLRTGRRRCVLVWKKSRWQTRDCKKGKAHPYVCYIQI
ncbi:hypothetical protein DNTS_033831 [Danionella cerebrum]|uniref:FRAS1-related extracellular matrix protein 1 n=1 Tax=Danionella cerebrum TaxID=2873325 RepID=A0A553R5K7_9TELE|nr:hypothetical protein DNTS_033831 [Danionella translucida]